MRDGLWRGCPCIVYGFTEGKITLVYLYRSKRQVWVATDEIK